MSGHRGSGDRGEAPRLLQPRPVSPTLVFLLGLLLPGAGHYLLGQRAKAFLVFLGAVASCGLLGLYNLLAALDGLHLARKLRRGEPIGPWEGWGLLDRLADWF